MVKIRAATFKSKNPFNQTAIYSLRNSTDGDSILLELSKFLTELSKTVYDKPKILNFYNLLNPYIAIDEGKSKLFTRSEVAVTGVEANGVNDWNGSISFKWNKFNHGSNSNTIWVARQLAANILCLIEVEDRITFKAFHSDRIYDKKFNYQKAVDSNDSIDIDVGLLSNYPIRNIKKHFFDKNTDETCCNRNCLEVELELPEGHSLFILLNHLKSKGNRTTAISNNPKKMKTGTIHDIILINYNLLNDQSLRMF